jgi:hypothetical protein
MTGRHALSAFTSIRTGMSLEAILERLGPPQRHLTAGTQVLDYRLSDGSRVEIIFANPRLMKMIHYRANGTRMTWIPS